MGNNPGISNIQILIETCSPDRYRKDGNLGEIRGGFVWGLLPSVRKETGLCVTTYKCTVGSLCESTLETVKHFTNVEQGYYHYFKMLPYHPEKLMCLPRVTRAMKKVKFL